MQTATVSKNIQKTIFLSKKGFKELRHDISRLQHDRQKCIRGLKELDRASGHDDRLERIERLAQLEAIESELNEKKLLSMNAKLLPTKKERMHVALGSVVDLLDQHGQFVRYMIVDSMEANPSDGRISAASPLGQHLLGKTVKDIVEWKNGLHSRTFRLVKIT